MYDLSPHKEVTFTDEWKIFRDEMDFMELQREAKLQQVANEMSRVKNEMSRHGIELDDLTIRAGKTEQILAVHQQDLDHQFVVNKFLFKEVAELKEAHLESRTSDLEYMKKITTGISERTALLEQNLQKLIAERDDIVVDSGSRKRVPIGSGVKGERRPCPFCGKELTVKYLKYDHRQKHCKKAPTAAVDPGMEEKEPEAVFVISDIRTVDGTPLFCSEEIDPTGDLEFPKNGNSSEVAPQAKL